MLGCGCSPHCGPCFPGRRARMVCIPRSEFAHAAHPSSLDAAVGVLKRLESVMPANETTTLTREKFIELLNEDLSREYQAIIAYVNYSQVLKGAAYMNIAAELEVHAHEELSHALTIAR